MNYCVNGVREYVTPFDEEPKCHVLLYLDTLFFFFPDLWPVTVFANYPRINVICDDLLNVSSKNKYLFKITIFTESQVCAGGRRRPGGWKGFFSQNPSKKREKSVFQRDLFKNSNL